MSDPDLVLNRLYRELRALQEREPTRNQISVGALSPRTSAVYLAVERVLRGECVDV